MTVRAAKVLMVCALASAAAGAAAATQVVSVSDEFFVVHDYATVTVSPAQAATARLYIGDDQFVLQALAAADRDAVRAIALDGLKSKVQIVPRKEDANLVAQVTVNPRINLAIRNPKHAPAQGYVMLGICRFPITSTIAGDCDNLTYFYFADDKPAEIFRTIFAKWLSAKFPPAGK